MTNPIDNLMEVNDGSSNVVAVNHNTNVFGLRFLAGAMANRNSGTMKYARIGAIADPVSAPVAVVTNDTGNFSSETVAYKYTCVNLSGETVESAASSTVSVNAKTVDVTIPVQPVTTNLTGYNIYRSRSGGTYYYVTTVYPSDMSEPYVFTDDLHEIDVAQTVTPVPGVNTTSTTATIAGMLFCENFVMTTGQTLVISSSGSYAGFLAIMCSDYASITGTITGNTKLAKTNIRESHTLSGSSVYSQHGDQGRISKAIGRYYDVLNRQGIGATGSLAGGSLVIYAKNVVNLDALTMNFDGGTGSAGGLVVIQTDALRASTATLSANGGAGANGSAGTGAGGGGAGGAFFALCNVLEGTVTVTALGGANGTNYAGTPTVPGSAGGSFLTDGGNGQLNNGANPATSGATGTSSISTSSMHLDGSPLLLDFTYITGMGAF